jgi:hypothetical protein
MGCGRSVRGDFKMVECRLGWCLRRKRGLRVHYLGIEQRVVGHKVERRGVEENEKYTADTLSPNPTASNKGLGYRFK